MMVLIALAFTVFLVWNTSNVNAIDLDPGDGSGYVYANITVTFKTLQCVADTDAMSGTGLARGGADVWCRTAGSGFTTINSQPYVLDKYYGIPNDSGILLPETIIAQRFGMNIWNGQYFTVTYNNVYLDGDKTLDLFVYDQDLLGFKQELVQARLVIKSIGSVISPRDYNNIFAEFPNDYVDSYIDFGRVDGAYYSTYVPTPWGSYTWTWPNGLFIDLDIVYHS